MTLSAAAREIAPDVPSEYDRLQSSVNAKISRGEIDDALAEANSAETAFLARKDVAGAALAGFLLGTAYRRANNLAESLRCHTNGYERYLSAGDWLGAANALRARSGTLRILGRDSEAVADLSHCLDIYNERVRVASRRSPRSL